MTDPKPPAGPAGAGPVPQIPAGKDYTAVSRFEPAAILREARRQKRLAERNVPAVCVLDPDGDIVRRLRRTGAARRNEAWACYHTTLFEFSAGRWTFGIVACAVGAPFAVLIAEQLFASGCRFLLSITSAPFAAADLELVESVEPAVRAATRIAVYRGPSWTTDAPFRETAAAIAGAKDRGILCVEMEAAGLYSFAGAKRKPVVCMAYVTNTMGQARGDFEKGEAEGASVALRVIAAAGGAWLAAHGEGTP